jgi:aspartate 1-decarboxylase
MLRAKLHRATVTQSDLNYEGSCGIDAALLEEADMREFEYIEIYNIDNGERFTTYIIAAAPGSGEISLNGAAARRAQVGDRLIICTYAPFDESAVVSHRPRIVLLDAGNRINKVIKGA